MTNVRGSGELSRPRGIDTQSNISAKLLALSARTAHIRPCSYPLLLCSTEPDHYVCYVRACLSQVSLWMRRPVWTTCKGPTVGKTKTTTQTHEKRWGTGGSNSLWAFWQMPVPVLNPAWSRNNTHTEIIWEPKQKKAQKKGCRVFKKNNSLL